MRFLGVIIVLLSLAGCASDPAPTPQTDVMAEEHARDQASAALEAAHGLLKEAHAIGWGTDTLEVLLKRAEDAFAKGDYELATRLGQQVQEFAHTGINRQQLSLARDFEDKIKHLTRLTPEHRAQLDDIQHAIAAGDGPRAFELSRQLHGALQAARIQYDVVKGDSLWGIAGKPTIYADPFQWPLIYKANHDQIKDADLIYPGQNLGIEQYPSQGDVDAAVEHAKHRGAWSIGPQEASDKAYLGK